MNMEENSVCKKRIYFLLLLSIFLILAFLVRGCHPGADAPFDLSWSQGPSTDPSYYLEPAISLVKSGELSPISKSWNAPGYYMLYLPTLYIFGTGFTQVNLTTVVISLIGFFFFFLILYRMGDRMTLVFASIFWVFSFFWAMYNRVPIIYTAMIMYMLIALYFWYLGTTKPIYYIFSWAILIIATLYVRVIAVVLVPVFVVGHLIFFVAKARDKGKELKKVLIPLIAIALGGVVLMIVMGWLLDISLIDVARGRVIVHLRGELFGDDTLLHFFNLGASGGLVDFQPMVFFLAYISIIIYIRDLLGENHKMARIDFKDPNELIRLIFLLWLVIGGLATIFFKYAPPRYYLFLMPPMFFMAGHTLSRFLDPRPRVEMGYGYYLLLLLWLLFLNFKLLLKVVVYFSSNFVTLVRGLALSEATARSFALLINFFSSFFLLLSISLIASLIIMLIFYLFDRKVRKEDDLVIRRGTRVFVSVVILSIFIFYQGGMYINWSRNPHYTLHNTSVSLEGILGPGALLAGSYAHPLTMENDLDRVYMTFIRPDSEAPCERFEKMGVTHLIIDTESGLDYIIEYYPDTRHCLDYLETLYVRGVPIVLYRYKGNEDYSPTDYEKARGLMASNDYPGAGELLSRFLAKNPDSPPALVSLGRCLIGTGDLAGANNALKRAIEVNPDNMEAHFEMGKLLNYMGDKRGALFHYGEAIRLYPDNDDIRKKIDELIDGT